MAKISIAPMIRAYRGYVTLLKSREREKIPQSEILPLIDVVVPEIVPSPEATDLLGKIGPKS